MQEFIALENIKRFRRQLENCTNVQHRQTLERLLEEEQAKLQALQRQPNSAHLPE
jgi:hypothetical protein